MSSHLFIGVGIYLFGQASFGAFFAGVGLLGGAIGVGIMIAHYFYPNTSEELTNAVEEFEKKEVNAPIRALLTNCWSEISPSSGFLCGFVLFFTLRDLR